MIFLTFKDFSSNDENFTNFLLSFSTHNGSSYQNVFVLRFSPSPTLNIQSHRRLSYGIELFTEKITVERFSQHFLLQFFSFMLIHNLVKMLLISLLNDLAN